RGAEGYRHPRECRGRERDERTRHEGGAGEGWLRAQGQLAGAVRRVHARRNRAERETDPRQRREGGAGERALNYSRPAAASSFLASAEPKTRTKAPARSRSGLPVPTAISYEVTLCSSSGKRPARATARPFST